MKKHIFPIALPVIAAAFALFTTSVIAENKSVPALPYGAANVLKLAPTQATRPTTPVVAAPQYPPYSGPVITYVQSPAPLVVMRDSSPRLVDYGIYPRYGSYYGSYGCSPGYGYRSYYSNPRASFSIGFSGHHGGFGFRSGGFYGRHCW